MGWLGPEQLESPLATDMRTKQLHLESKDNLKTQRVSGEDKTSQTRVLTAWKYKRGTLRLSV